MSSPPDPFSPQALAELKASPGLWPAIATAAQGSLANFDSRAGEMRWMFQDRGRYMTGLAAVALLGMEALTLPALRSTCAAMQVSSPGRVNRFWTGMRAGGHLTMTRMPDGRLDRRLTASPEFIDQFRRHRRVMVEAVGCLWPETAKAALSLIEDDASYLKFEAAICGVQAMHRDLFQTQRDAPIYMFIERNAGLLILMLLLTEDPPATHDLSIHALAKRFEVSRAHVKKLFNDARDAGLVEIDETARTVRFTATAVEAYAETSAMLLQAVRIGLDMALAQARARQPL